MDVLLGAGAFVLGLGVAALIAAIWLVKNNPWR
jgi:hypothetical protein